MFLRNTWYVLARSGDIGEALTPIEILGEQVVVWRNADGTVAALEDACPHRKLPLSMGTRQGDRVVCGYHGLTFDGTGSCVAAPTQSKIPSTARVKSYPTAERWGFVWIWMGDPAKADTAKIFTVGNHDTPGWGMSGGDVMVCACNYLWLADNLLDPSHVAWVHLTSFAAAGTEDTPLDVETTETGVIVSRWMTNRDVPPFYAPLVKFAGKCDRLQHYEVRFPGIGVNKSVYTPAGFGGKDKPPYPDAYVMVSYHFLTPVNASTTRYFWLQTRNTDAGNAEISRQIAAGARRAFEEDRVILEAVHKGMATPATPSLDLALDAGALRFRRALQALIDQEKAAA